MEEDVSLTISSHVSLIKLELALSRFELWGKVKWLSKNTTFTQERINTRILIAFLLQSFLFVVGITSFFVSFATISTISLSFVWRHIILDTIGSKKVDVQRMGWVKL